MKECQDIQMDGLDTYTDSTGTEDRQANQPTECTNNQTEV